MSRAEPGWQRRAGRGRTADGRMVTWTVADGSRGRRWRELVTDDGVLVHALTLESLPDGRFAHLELAGRAGLLTLHPEPDATLHGNAVTGAGVRHVAGLPWPPDAVLLVDGSPVAAAAAIHALRARRHVGWPGHEPAAPGVAGDVVPLVVVTSGLEVERRAERLWLAEAAGGAYELGGRARLGRADRDGLPLLADAASWPLELAEDDHPHA